MFDPTSKLIRMAGQMAEFFRSQPDRPRPRPSPPISTTAGTIQMRRDFIAAVQAGPRPTRSCATPCVLSGCRKGRRTGRAGPDFASAARQSGRASLPAMAQIPSRQEILDWVMTHPEATAKRDIAKAFNIKGAERIELEAPPERA